MKIQNFKDFMMMEDGEGGVAAGTYSPGGPGTGVQNITSPMFRLGNKKTNRRTPQMKKGKKKVA